MRSVERMPSMAAVMLCLASSAARAAEGDSTQVAPPPGSLHAALGSRSQDRSPGTALALSAAATLGPILLGAASEDWPALAAGGILLGPAAGYLYGDCTGRGIQGILVRSGLVALGFGIGLGVSRNDSELPSGLGFVAAGVTAATCVSLYDIGMVTEHVQRRNAKRARSMRLEPTLRLAADGTPLVGVTLRSGG